MNFITEDLVQRLGLTTKSTDISVVGINHACNKIQETTQLQIHSRHYSFKTTIDCLIIRQITERLLNVTMKRENFKIPRNLPLADPEFYRSTDVDILLGAETF